MPKIEALVYSPKNMDNFIKFCVEGKRKPSGGGEPSGDVEFETDDQNRDIRGVFDWLHGREVPAAQFFHTPADNNAFQFFIALVQKNDKEKVERPWFRNVEVELPSTIALESEIAGVEKELNFDGRFGTLQEFVPLPTLFELVTEDKELGAQFEAGKKRVKEILDAIGTDENTRRRFLATLRSDKGINSAEVREDLKSKFGLTF